MSKHYNLYLKKRNSLLIDLSVIIPIPELLGSSTQGSAPRALQAQY